MKNKDKKSIIERLQTKDRRRKIYHSGIPEEYKEDKDIIDEERKIDMRRIDRIGFDVINQVYFVHEFVLDYNEFNREEFWTKSLRVFEDFDNYYDYLDGSIYDNSCYYQCDLSKIKKKIDEVKIVFSDIDGTFLNNDHHVSEKTQQAVKSLIGQSIKFVLVSARMPEAIYPITNKIDVKIPIISYSGALVLSEAQEILYNKVIDIESTKNVLNEISLNYSDITVNYYAGRHWFVQNINDERVKQEMDITSAIAESANFDELISKNIKPNKILVMCEPKICQKMETELGKIFDNLNVVRSANTLLEIMDKSVSKATGIKVLLNHYGFTIENAIGFGDNYNDVEMLKFVGCGVAMNNAPEDVKKFADDITDSNENDGIYNYLVRKNLIK